MPVGDEDAAHRRPLPSVPMERPPQKEASADESGVDQVQSRAVSKDIKIHPRSADLEDVADRWHFKK